jgi:hypothetical protein
MPLIHVYDVQVCGVIYLFMMFNFVGCVNDVHLIYIVHVMFLSGL